MNVHCILIMLIGLLYDFDIGKSDEEITKYYHLFTFFKDMNIFIFIGFGFLLSFLRDHQWSSILLVLFLGSVAIEFSFFGYYSDLFSILLASDSITKSGEPVFVFL